MGRRKNGSRHESSRCLRSREPLSFPKTATKTTSFGVSDIFSLYSKIQENTPVGQQRKDSLLIVDNDSDLSEEMITLIWSIT